MILQKLPNWLLPFLVLAAFCACEYSWLSHPYFWDEAWSYGHTIHQFAAQRLSISPASLDPELSRGHPLLFYTGTAAWLQLTDNHLFYAHLFALLISALTAGVVWQMARQLSGAWAAGFALVALLVSQAFFALSTRLYPEMMVALFSMLALWGFFQEKRASTVLWCVLLLFTKESGLAVLAALFVFALWRHRGFVRAFWKDAALLTLSMLPVLAWFYWQYTLRGWWLFPEHTGMIVHDMGKVLRNLLQQFWTLVFYDGRSVLTLAALIAAGWQKWRRHVPVRPALWQFTVLMGLFIGAYLTFTALNFQTERYLVVPLVAYLLTAVLWVWEGFAPQPVIRAALLSAYLFTQAYFLVWPVREMEVTTGYLPMMRTWQAGVQWCETQHLQSEPIWSFYLMRFYMTDPYLGYLSENKPFMFVESPEAARYFLFDSAESGVLAPEFTEKFKLRLVHTVGDGKHAVWIYERAAPEK